MISSFITDATPAGDFEKISVAATAIPFTASKILINITGGVHKRAVKAFVTVETNSIRIRTDGTAPDASTGHLFTAGSSFTIIGEDDVRRFQAIQASAGASIMVTYFYNL